MRAFQLFGSTMLMLLTAIAHATAQVSEPEGPRTEIRALGSYEDDMRSILASGARRPVAVMPRTKRPDSETDARPEQPLAAPPSPTERPR